MFHTPVSEQKTKADLSSNARPLLEQEQSLLLGQSPQYPKQRNHPLALQKTYGNQAVLRMRQRERRYQQDVSRRELPVQTKLKVSEPGDPCEQQANRVAEQVMRVPKNQPCSVCETEEKQVQREILPTSIARPRQAGSIVSDQVTQQINTIKGSGDQLDNNTRSFMESRFNTDFSRVRVHTNSDAARISEELNAQAFAVGNDIYFNTGSYAPTTEHGKYLLAHELTHTLQQTDRTEIQRACSDPNFCTPYATAEEATSAEWWVRNVYMPLEGVPTYGRGSMELYENFLDRRPGDSLEPVVFSSESSYLLSSFRDSWDTADDQDAVIDLVGERLSSAPGPPLRDYQVNMMSLSNFLSETEMNNRPINYRNPFSVAGHIAGGIGSSDAGLDYRKITSGNVTLEKIPVIGGTGYVSVETTLHYEIFDAIDFCPGDCGSSAEQYITVPMSRLEASGEAYDVPFKVIFTPESRSKRFWY